MSDPPERAERPRSSRRRYQAFVQDYKQRRLDAPTDEPAKEPVTAPGGRTRDTRREHLRAYLRRLRPHRSAVVAILVVALAVAALEMAEPLFMRFIIDRVLLDTGADPAARLADLHLAGAAFLAVVILSKLAGVLKDYRQKLLNIRVMLSLRRALYDRLLHLPLPKLWGMKTGGILSRLSGDIDTTTGLLQMAVVSPALSAVRLVIAIGVLLALNWRLALMALAVIPGAVLMSFAFARRVRPIYRSARKDVEVIDGRAGETFGGIRVVRAFGREVRELLDYMLGRHTVLRKELFAHRRELILWTSWGLLVAGVNVVIIWYGGYLVVTGRASVGDIMAFQWYTLLLMGPVWNIVNSFSELQRSLAAMERVFEVLVAEADKPDRPGAVAAPAVVTEVRFEGVEFEYDAGRPVVRDVRRGRAGRLGYRAGGPERGREDDGDRPGGAVPRPHPGAHPGQRHGRARLPAADIPRAAGPGPAGHVPVRRVGPGQHRIRAPRRDRRRGRGRGAAGQRRTISSRSCPTGTGPWSANVEFDCRAGSSSGWPSPGRSWRPPRS